jgi:hypothetical protein
MSLFSSVANYGGKQPDNSQGIKQFVQSPGSQATWVYKRLPSGLQVQTPADKIRPVYINSDLYVNGSIYNPSDSSLKKDVKMIDGENVDNIMNLNPVSFKFKDDINSKEHFGFIAQDVEKLYPELVKKTEMGYKTVNYIELIPVLVSKIQDMDEEIKELKQQIKELYNYCK